MQPTRKAFRDVGTSGLVNLAAEQKSDVIIALESMAAEVAGGDDDLPDDLFELRNALRLTSPRRLVGAGSRCNYSVEGGSRRVGDTKQEREVRALMKAKLLREAGEITEGTEVEIASRAGTNESRSDEDEGGRSSTVAPVYEVTDDEGHAEKVDTRDLKPLP